MNLPTKNGESIISGNLTVKRVKAGVYTARDTRVKRHARWGDAKQIRQDMAHFATYDVLPRAKVSWL